MKTRKALTYLVTGVSGQDGFYAARHFLKSGSWVVGTSRHRLEAGKSHLQLLARHPRFRYISMPEYTKERIDVLIEQVRPERVVHCAGFRDIPSNATEAAQCFFTNRDLVEMLLSALERFVPTARFLFLSSAEIFRLEANVVLDETFPLAPQNDYGVSKVAGMELVERYRTGRGIFAVSAICFNHDSCLSPQAHLVRLVPRKLLMLKNGATDRVSFYNPGMRRDWSHARDFVTAFDKLLEQGEPRDFLVGSGIATTLRDYVNLTCDLLHIDDRSAITFEERPDQQSYDRIACVDRLKRELGWAPKISLRLLCREMIRWEKRKQGQHGER